MKNNDPYKMIIQEKRFDYAVNELNKLGYNLIIKSDSEINFNYNGNLIKFFPYTGWHTGKGIKDGRGINNLLNQLK